jgi:tellurite methyltransferase
VEQDRDKWNARYAAGSLFLGPHPSSFLAERIDLIESLVPGRKALDIACGEGRNSIFLARRGFTVTGIDISEEGLTKAARWATGEGLEIAFLRANLEGYLFTERYDLILNFNFLLRDLIPGTVAALSPGGVLLFDTILDSPALPGVHRKEFLLQPGELPAIFAQFPGTVLHYEERPLDVSPTAKLIFRKQAG